jgi:internalin A
LYKEDIIELDLSDNNIRELPKEFRGLSNLTTLNLSNNQMTAIPDFLEDMLTLKRIDLRGNPINHQQVVTLLARFGNKILF